MKNTLAKRKNKLEGLTGRLNEAEGQISNLENKAAENTQLEQQKEGKEAFQNEGSLRGPWDNIEHTNIHIIGVGVRRKRERANNWKNNDGNFLNVVKDTDLQV